MAKKLDKSIKKGKDASGAKLLDSDLANAVQDSAQQIWLAGLGAFAKAQEEGGKVFEALVKDGAHLQRKTQGLAEEHLRAVRGKVRAIADGVNSQAGAQWDKLESIFETRIAKALHKMGVPQTQDIDALARRIDTLTALVAGKSPPARKAATAARKAAPTARRSPRGKSKAP